MAKQDTRAWERELEHSQMMQKQRKSCDVKRVRFAGGKTYELPKTTKRSNKNEK